MPRPKYHSIPLEQTMPDAEAVKITLMVPKAFLYDEIQSIADLVKEYEWTVVEGLREALKDKRCAKYGHRHPQVEAFQNGDYRDDIPDDHPHP